MAKERIDDIVSQSAIEQLLSLGEHLAEVKLQMEELILLADKFGKDMQSASNIRDMSSSMQNLATATGNLSNANKTRLEIEREIKTTGEAMAKQISEETNQFEKLAQVMEQHAKSQGETAKRVVELKDAINSTREAMKRSREEYEAGNISREEYLKAQAKGTKAVEAHSIALQNEKRDLKNITKDLKSTEGSYNQMTARLNQLRSIWRGLSEEERNNADIGGVVTAEINNLDEALKGLDKSVGNNQRNVGNYEVAMGAMPNILRVAGLGVRGLSKSFMAFLANPIVALITAIVFAIKGLVSAFKNNQTAMDNLKNAFMALEPILNLFKKIIGSIVEGISRMIVFYAKLYETIIGKISPAYKQQVQNLRDLKKAQEDLARSERKYANDKVVRDGEIEKLRDMYADKERYSNKERLEFLKEIGEKERADAKEKKDNAKKEADIARASGKSAEERHNAHIKYMEALNNYNNVIRDSGKEYSDAFKAMRDEELKAAQEKAKEAEERKKIEREREQNAKELLEKSLKRTQDYYDTLNELELKSIKDATEYENKRFELLKERLQRERDEKLEAEGITLEEINAIEALYQEKELAAEREHNENLNAIEEKRYDDLLKSLSEKQKHLDDELLAIDVSGASNRYQARIDLLRTFFDEQQRLLDEYYAQGLLTEEDYTRQSNQLTMERIKLADEETKKKFSAANSIVDSITNVMSAGAEQIADEKKRVKIEQGIAMAKVLLQEGLAIAELATTQASADPYTFIPRMIASMATITTTFITAISAINKAQNAYAEGTDYHRGGSAIVGEGVSNGHWQSELVQTPDGKSFIVDKPTFFDSLPVGTSVKPIGAGGNIGFDMSETNGILQTIADKNTVVVNVDDHITKYILAKNSRIKVLNSKFKMN